MVAVTVPAPPNEEDRRASERRRERLLAALLDEGVSQADLHRRLVEAGERTSPATVSNWCRGASTITEIQIRGLLSLLGKERSWEPSADLVRQAVAEQAARERIPRESRAKPKRSTKA